MLGFYLLYKTKPLEPVLLFAPTPPEQPVPKFLGNFGTGDVLLSRLPAQIFPEILGQETFGDYSLLFSPQNSPEILGGTGDATSRDYTRPEISGKFWDGPSQIFQEILERFF